jgi:hypothetical protein
VVIQTTSHSFKDDNRAEALAVTTTLAGKITLRIRPKSRARATSFAPSGRGWLAMRRPAAVTSTKSQEGGLPGDGPAPLQQGDEGAAQAAPNGLPNVDDDVPDLDRRVEISSVRKPAGLAADGASTIAQEETNIYPIPGQVDEADLQMGDNSASVSSPLTLSPRGPPGQVSQLSSRGPEKPSTLREAVKGALENPAERPDRRSKLIGRMSEFGDNASLAGPEEDISQEQLQMIKARTMFQMTEEIFDDTGGGRKRLLFLTNSQAEFLAGSSSSLQKMLEALEIPRPKLIINLLSSQGFTDYCKNMGAMEDLGKEETGLVPGRGSFLALDDEISAIEKLDHFMASVILPLAAQTQAIIICNACPNNCMLSSSLTRMLSVHRSKWGQDIPFTVLSVSANVPYLYQNPDESAVWRSDET